MTTFETLKCPDCRAQFAVESAALHDEVQEVTCPLCEASVEVEPEEAETDPEDDDEDMD